MAEGKTFRLKWENYKEQCASHWPSIGKHILAQYDKDYIVVYQAFCPDIADYAVKHGKFGGMRYSFTRMTWIKTNFLWMMYRSNWAQKKNQNRILAIYLSIEGFDQILKFSRGNGIRPEGRTPGNVRIQWDPDHDPKGGNQRRRAVQLGIKGIPLERFHEQYIQHIEDITDIVHEQRQHVLKNELHKLQTPAERVYTPSDISICRHILLDEFHDRTGEAKGKVTADDFKDSDNTDEERSDLDKHDKPCGKELQYTTCTKPVFAGDKVDLIVCLGGSFNPVHVGHIQMLDSAVKWLSNMANYNVVAAHLAVAPDSYVEKKCKRKGDRCIKAEHRIKLCELACSGQKLIKAHFTTTHSARNCGENVKKWENFKNAKVAVVIGADKAAFSNGHWKWKAKSKCLTVCVGRKGQTEAVRKAYAEEFKEDLVTNPDFIMIEDEIDNINSTEIRQQLSETDYDMKYDVNNQTNEELLSNPSTMKEHSTCKNMTDKSLNDQENRKVPSNCVELPHVPDKELKSMNLKDDYTAISEGNVGNQINEENIPLSWEELEAVDDMPAACNSLKSDLNIHKDKNSSLEQEKYGARLKTRYSGSIDLKETVNKLNDKDQSTDKHSRKYVIDDLVSNGWLAKPVGDYMLEKFFDLYL